MKYLLVPFLILSFMVMPIVGYSDDSSVTEQVDEQNSWESLGFYALTVLISVSGTLILFAGKIGLKKLEKKLGIDVPEAIEQMAEGILIKGINSTENWAKKQANKPTSENKLAEAIRFALEEAGNNEFVRKKIEDKGKEIIERLLRSEETSDEVTPK